jgi:hypothetical protein
VKLTDVEWRAVYKLRVRGRSGATFDQAEQKLLERALKEDPARYRELGHDAFDATVPFGSTTRARREDP